MASLIDPLVHNPVADSIGTIVDAVTDPIGSVPSSGDDDSEEDEEEKEEKDEKENEQEDEFDLYGYIVRHEWDANHQFIQPFVSDVTLHSQLRLTDPLTASAAAFKDRQPLVDADDRKGLHQYLHYALRRRMDEWVHSIEETKRRLAADYVASTPTQLLDRLEKEFDNIEFHKLLQAAGVDRNLAHTRYFRFVLYPMLVALLRHVYMARIAIRISVTDHSVRWRAVHDRFKAIWQQGVDVYGEALSKLLPAEMNDDALWVAVTIRDDRLYTDTLHALDHNTLFMLSGPDERKHINDEWNRVLTHAMRAVVGEAVAGVKHEGENTVAYSARVQRSMNDDQYKFMNGFLHIRATTTLLYILHIQQTLIGAWEVGMNDMICVHTELGKQLIQHPDEIQSLWQPLCEVNVRWNEWTRNVQEPLQTVVLRAVVACEELESLPLHKDYCEVIRQTNDAAEAYRRGILHIVGETMRFYMNKEVDTSTLAKRIRQTSIRVERMAVVANRLKKENAAVWGRQVSRYYLRMQVFVNYLSSLKDECESEHRVREPADDAACATVDDVLDKVADVFNSWLEEVRTRRMWSETPSVSLTEQVKGLVFIGEVLAQCASRLIEEDGMAYVGLGGGDTPLDWLIPRMQQFVDQCRALVAQLSPAQKAIAYYNRFVELDREIQEYVLILQRPVITTPEDAEEKYRLMWEGLGEWANDAHEHTWLSRGVHRFGFANDGGAYNQFLFEILDHFSTWATPQGGVHSTAQLQYTHTALFQMYLLSLGTHRLLYLTDRMNDTSLDYFNGQDMKLVEARVRQVREQSSQLIRDNQRKVHTFSEWKRLWSQYDDNIISLIHYLFWILQYASEHYAVRLSIPEGGGVETEPGDYIDATVTTQMVFHATTELLKMFPGQLPLGGPYVLWMAEMLLGPMENQLLREFCYMHNAFPLLGMDRHQIETLLKCILDKLDELPREEKSDLAWVETTCLHLHNKRDRSLRSALSKRIKQLLLMLSEDSGGLFVMATPRFKVIHKLYNVYCGLEQMTVAFVEQLARSMGSSTRSSGIDREVLVRLKDAFGIVVAGTMTGQETIDTSNHIFDIPSDWRAALLGPGAPVPSLDMRGRPELFWTHYTHLHHAMRGRKWSTTIRIDGHADAKDAWKRRWTIVQRALVTRSAQVYDAKTRVMVYRSDVAYDFAPGVSFLMPSDESILLAMVQVIHNVYSGWIAVRPLSPSLFKSLSDQTTFVGAQLTVVLLMSSKHNGGSTAGVDLKPYVKHWMLDWGVQWKNQGQMVEFQDPDGVWDYTLSPPRFNPMHRAVKRWSDMMSSMEFARFMGMLWLTLIIQQDHVLLTALRDFVLCYTPQFPGMSEVWSNAGNIKDALDKAETQVAYLQGPAWID